MGRVHLSFDNGPDPEVTPRVLGVLERHRVTASFFVLGRHLATPWGMDLAREIHAAGHRLGNHSWSHSVPLGDDPRPDGVERELAATQDLLDEVVEGPVLFRPFGGGGHIGPHLLSPAAVTWLEERSATCVLWSSVPGDWLDAHGWPVRALADAVAQDHALVVLHDILPEAMSHLDGFLHALAERGHTLTHALPEACLPMVGGVPRPGLNDLVRHPTEAP